MKDPFVCTANEAPATKNSKFLHGRNASFIMSLEESVIPDFMSFPNPLRSNFKGEGKSSSVKFLLQVSHSIFAAN